MYAEHRPELYLTFPMKLYNHHYFGILKVRSTEAPQRGNKLAQLDNN